jgi:hypothetical protein
MAYITGSVSDTIGTLPFSLAANSQLTMSIQNNGNAPSYWGLETIPNNNGFYTSTTPKNLSGSFISGSGISNVVYDDYKMSAVVNPGGGTLVFNNAVAISASTLWTRATAPSPLPGDFPYALANGYSARVSRSNGVTEASSAIVSSIQTLPMLQNASFLYIPSGYASGSAFSQLSTNDYGDLSFTRASSATRTLANGTVETPRTNHIRNSSMVGASTSPSTLPTNWIATLAGLTQTVVGIGTENGLPYIDVQFSGTATSTSSVLRFALETQIVASNGQTWASSFWIKEIAAPSPANSYINVIQERNSGGTILISSVQTITISSILTRNIFTRTNTNASTGRINNGVGVNLTIGNTYDFTIRIAAPQMELGFQATDWIPTTNSTRTIFAGITQDGTTGGNISRLDYSYGSDPALLLEPQRTNTIRNSTMMSASVAGNILPTSWNLVGNGLSSTVVGVGTENGLPYVDVQLSGTATFNAGVLFFESGTQIVASNGQTWTNSFWAKIISTTLPPTAYRLNITERTSAGSYISETNTTFTPSSTLTRFTQSVTLAGGATVDRVQSGFAWSMINGQSYNFTIRIAAPQLELGAYATTWIPTYLNSATRVADTFTRNNIFTNGLISASGGTWYVELRNNVAYVRDSSVNAIWIGDNSNGTLNAILLRNPSASSSRLVVAIRISGTLTSVFTTTTDSVKISIKWNGTSADVFVNGTKVVSAIAFTTTNMEFLAASGTQVPTFIQAMALYPQPLSNVDSGVLTGASYYPSFFNMAQALNYTIA